MDRHEVTPRTVHSLWNNISVWDLRVVIGTRHSPPLKRHFSLLEYTHVTPNGQTWPQQQLVPCGHSRSRRCHHDQWLHLIIIIKQQTVVQEPARRTLCIDGECVELFVCQIIFVGVAAATLIYGLQCDSLVFHIRLLTSL